MDRLKHIIKKEIYEIEDSGLSNKNVGLLGELVDIYKDLVNIEYWCSEMASVSPQPSWGSSPLAPAISERIGEIMTINTNLKLKDSPELTKEFNTKVDDLLSIVETIRISLKDVPLSSSHKQKYDIYFK